MAGYIEDFEDDGMSVGERPLSIRPLVHVALAFIFLCLIGFTVGMRSSKASPTPEGYEITVATIAVKPLAEDKNDPAIEIPTAPRNSPEAVFKSTSLDTARVLFVLSISLLAIFNLALYRHMRFAYSRQRKRRKLG